MDEIKIKRKGFRDAVVKLGTDEEEYWYNILKNSEIQLKQLTSELENREKGIKDVESQIRFTKGIMEYAKSKTNDKEVNNTNGKR